MLPTPAPCTSAVFLPQHVAEWSASRCRLWFYIFFSFVQQTLTGVSESEFPKRKHLGSQITSSVQPKASSLWLRFGGGVWGKPRAPTWPPTSSPVPLPSHRGASVCRGREFSPEEQRRMQTLQKVSNTFCNLGKKIK